MKFTDAGAGGCCDAGELIVLGACGPSYEGKYLYADKKVTT